MNLKYSGTEVGFPSVSNNSSAFHQGPRPQMSAARVIEKIPYTLLAGKKGVWDICVRGLKGLEELC